MRNVRAANKRIDRLSMDVGAAHARISSLEERFAEHTRHVARPAQAGHTEDPLP